jgi:hypothetical protein
VLLSHQHSTLADTSAHRVVDAAMCRVKVMVVEFSRPGYAYSSQQRIRLTMHGMFCSAACVLACVERVSVLCFAGVLALMI